MTARVLVAALVCLLAGTAGQAVQSPAVSAAADLAEHGHWKRLKPIVEARVRANANDAEAQWLLSRVRLAYGDHDAALGPAEKAAALDPKNVEYRCQLAQVVGELASNASVFRQPGLGKRFKREVEAALALDPRHVPSMIGLMEFYYQAPGIIGGDKKKAAEIANSIMALNKVDGAVAKARLLNRQSPYPAGEVEQLWVQAVTADPARFEPHMNLASIYSSGDKPRWELAEKEATAARRIDADRTGPYSVLAAFYAAHERWTDLDAVLADAEKRIPDNLTPFLRAGITLTTTGKDLPRAERYMRKYLAQEPEPQATQPAVAHWRLALVLEKQGRKADAVAELRRATQLDPKFAQAQKDLQRLK